MHKKQSLGGRLAALHRLIKLWAPMKKQVVVGALKIQGNLVKNPALVVQRLAAHWRPVFSAVPIS
eukprot:9889237-Karenia_brevis.AAC.1